MARFSEFDTRMKSYEDSARVQENAMIIRVDGKTFHRWTKSVRAKPFDERIHEAMLTAAEFTSKEMQGFRLGYTQSDECTFLCTRVDEESQLWFGGKIQKVATVTASMFTHYFNEYAMHYISRGNQPAFFDARVFGIPRDDAPNAFVWRQKDAVRNSKNVFARQFFSHREAQGISSDSLVEKAKDAGFADWNDLDPSFKYGTFVDKYRGFTSILRNYDLIEEEISNAEK